MRILVTGATGFIGSHLVNYLKKNHKVVAVVRDCFRTKWLREALEGTIRARGDIRDFHFLKRVINQYDISHVVHLAALSIVKKAHKDPINTFETNVMGTVKLLEACRQLEAEKVLMQSTDKVYGNQMGATIDSPLIPTEPYGTSKICADVVAQSFMKTYGMNIVVTRCCNVYGYDPFNDRIIPNTIKACIRGESPIIYRNYDSKRQYIFIEDVVDVIEKLLMYEGEGIFNIATPEIKTQEEVVLEILKYFPKLKPKYVEKPRIKEIKSQSIVPDFPKGWIPFEIGISRTIDSFYKYIQDWNIGGR